MRALQNSAFFVVVAVLATGCGSAQRARPADPTVVTQRDLEKHPNEPIEKVLQDKVPGLLVKRAPNGDLALQIRGASSIRGDDAPLYVLDDMPIDPGPEGTLSGVDPYTIESIKVLKGADAGIYGIRGANGVIVITTKKAKPTRKP